MCPRQPRTAKPEERGLGLPRRSRLGHLEEDPEPGGGGTASGTFLRKSRQLSCLESGLRRKRGGVGEAGGQARVPPGTPSSQESLWAESVSSSAESTFEPF